MQEGPESASVPDTSYEVLLTFVGVRVRESRKLAKLSQKDLARIIRSGQSYIVQIEAGEANITLKTLMRIAAAVGLPLRDFLPQEHPDQIAQALQTAMQNLDRASEQLRQLHKLVVDEPSNSAPTTHSRR